MLTLNSVPHQYIERHSQKVVTEKLLGDRSVSFLYNTVRENAPAMLRALTSGRMSRLLSLYHYDFLDKKRGAGRELFQKLGIDWRECVEEYSYYDTPRKVFERQIRYWDTRPMDTTRSAIVSPADSRILFGSFSDISELFIKEKFFDLEELLGRERGWSNLYSNGDFAVFRLTPEKYHYNHLPVSGEIVDIYEVGGRYHSCNPSALISIPSLYSKNKRVVTILDTDVEGGSWVGRVAMVEIVALMIGEIVQCYCTERYEHPVDLERGLFVHKGCPKSVYRPGSSTDVVIFQQGRVSFSPDLAANSRRYDVKSRFSIPGGYPLVETDILARSTIAHRCDGYGRPTQTQILKPHSTHTFKGE